MLIKPDIIETLGREGIELKLRGKNYWIKHHGEKTASCKISEQRYYCFGCGSHGSVIDFIMELHGLSFKDTLVYLGIKSGQLVKVDPAIVREKKIQKDYETAINNLYEKLCQQSRELHKISIQVKDNPGALTEQGAALFAQRMGELAAIDFKIDTLFKGDFDDKIFLLRGNVDAYCSGKIRRAAA